jgi:putative ABC transport system permease protein
MSATADRESLRAQPLMRPYVLLYLYRRRLRVHAVPELLAGLGVAIAVALIFATMVAAGSVTGSAREVDHAVVGPASLQLHARSAGGFPESLLGRVERLPGVHQAAPLLEQTATITGPGGRSVTVDLAGADTSLVVLDGLAHTLPRAALQAGGVGLSRQTAHQLGILGDPAAGAPPTHVWLRLGAQMRRLTVSAVLGPEAFGALSQAQVAVMPLEELQQLAGLHARISRVLVQTRPGHEGAVRTELTRLAGGRIDVASTGQDLALLRQALRPSEQASALFATVSGLLGLLLAFTAVLLTVPERRRAIADLRLIGVKRSAIVQMLLSQALALGVVASLIGLAGGYLLSHDLLHRSTGYLAEAFTLGNRTVIGMQPLLVAFAGGLAASCLATVICLADLRSGRVLDAVYEPHDPPGAPLPHRARVVLALAVATLLTATTLLFLLDPSLALVACVLLAFAAVLGVPLAFAGALRLAQALAQRVQRLTVLPVALGSLRSTALRSLALAATGALALFGAIALGGARGDLQHGIERFARAYSADADVWVGTPDDNQATVAFAPGTLGRRIAGIPGVAQVRTFQGGFMQFEGRRVWIIARPPGAARHVLDSQVLTGSAPAALAKIGQGGWIAISQQIASERHVGLGGVLTLPTPSGPARLRVAATTTDMAWSPGAIVMSTADYGRLWKTSAATALGVQLRPGASEARVTRLIGRALGPRSGLEATSASARERRIDALTSEGLGQLAQISMLLEIAAILALAAALASAIWQRRKSLAALRLSGVRPRRLRLILLVESTLILGAGVVTGALAGIYGQLVIDAYLRHVTGFPVTSLGEGSRPVEVFALVIALVLALAAVPGYRASRVSPALAFHE